MRAGRRRAAPAPGFTLVAMLAAVALVSIGLAVAGPIWGDRVRRDREQELLRVGALYANAIAEYRDSAPGSEHGYPPSLAQLALDTRFVGVQRHLRRLYPDPLDPTRPWGLVRDASGNIVGVYSQAAEAPVAQGRLRLGKLVLAPARHYSDWKFIAWSPS